MDAINGVAGGGCPENASAVNGVGDEVAEVVDDVGGSPV